MVLEAAQMIVGRSSCDTLNILIRLLAKMKEYTLPPMCLQRRVFLFEGLTLPDVPKIVSTLKTPVPGCGSLPMFCN